MNNKNIKYNLLPVWRALLEIHEAIRSICNCYRLQYWVTGGTALGAMRHKGFIPWDDDFDIMMYRSDYEKFWKIAARDLPQHLKWSSFEVNKDHPYSFGKVYDTRTDVVKKIERESNLRLVQGLFVDVFPIDGQPKTRCGLWLFKSVRGFIARVGGHLPISHNAYLRLYGSFIQHMPVEKSEFIGVAHSDGVHQDRCYWPKKWFETTVWKPFENTTVPLPGAAEEFIERHFHSWQQLPPKEKRIPSHQIINEESL